MSKKWFLIGSSVIGLCLLCFSLSAIFISNASEENDVFLTDGNKLMKYTGTSNQIAIPDKITVIAQGAFEGNEIITKVILPTGLETIEYNAFAECTSLKEIVIPDNVQSIGSSAFANCTSLSDVTFGKKISSIGNGIFAGCSSLEEVSIPLDNTYFTCIDGVILSADRSILYQMLPGRKKAYYVMSNRVTSIGQYAFWGCSNLQHVLLSDQLSNVNPYSFSNANGLKSVAMVFSVNEIGMKAFENCINLEQIYIPDSVSQIHETAFDGCTKLSIYAQDASKAADFAEEKSITIITSPKYELTIAQDLKDASLESLDDLTDNSNETADQTNSEGLLGSTNVVANQAVVLMNNTVADVVSGSNVKWNELLQTSIQDGMIPENLFYLKSDLKKITIPENVLTIGKFSFARSGITQLDIPQSVTKIEYGAFYHCDDLASVSIPSSVSVIEEKAFDNTAWMKEWLASSDNDYLIVGDGVLLAYKGEWKDFEVPADVKYISFSVEK